MDETESIIDVVTSSPDRDMDKESNMNVMENKETVEAASSASNEDATSKIILPLNQETGSPRRSTPSPDSTCSICLGKLENKSFTDSCFHTFCFTCLVEWSKVKAECPLCKQPFRSIIHSVRTFQDYDQYYLPPPAPAPLDQWQTSGRRFRYSTTLTSERRRQLAFERMLRFANRITRSNYSSERTDNLLINHPTTSQFRSHVYENGLWVKPSESVRIRETAPLFYRQNPACTHRLMPWLNRELNVLLHNSESQVTFLLELVLALILRYNITSPEFREHIYPFLRHKTSHFIHEFYHFARSPHHMVVYDQRAQYQRIDGSDANDPLGTPINTHLSDSTDSEIEILLSSPKSKPKKKKDKTHQYTVIPGDLDSGLPGTSSSYGSDEIFPDLTPIREEIAIDVQNCSDSNDSDCVIVTEMKPLRERTPEVIDVLSSDEEQEQPREKTKLKNKRVRPLKIKMNFQNLQKIHKKRKPRLKKLRKCKKTKVCSSSSGGERESSPELDVCTVAIEKSNASALLMETQVNANASALLMETQVNANASALLMETQANATCEAFSDNSSSSATLTYFSDSSEKDKPSPHKIKSVVVVCGDLKKETPPDSKSLIELLSINNRNNESLKKHEIITFP